MTQKILRSSLAWLTFCALIIGFSALPSSAHASQPPAKSSSQKTAASSATKSSASHKGMVWANPKTKIYHQEGDQWYGKSKGGKYMTQADAIKAGYRPAKPRHQLAHEKKK
ncbi:MAG: hypothetical protein ACRD2O_12265 [Terriglobia bacterium]